MIGVLCVVLVAIVLLELIGKGKLRNWAFLIVSLMSLFLPLKTVPEAEVQPLLVVVFVGAIIFNFGLGTFFRSLRNYLRFVIPLITLIILAVILGGKGFTIFSRTISLSVTELIVFPVLGAAIFQVTSFLQNKKKEESNLLMYLGYGGLFSVLFIASFLFSFWGVMLVAFGGVLMAFYSSIFLSRFIFSLFAIILIGYFSNINEDVTTVDLLLPKVTFGFFFGVFGTLLVSAVWELKRYRAIAVFTGYALFFGGALMLLWMSTQNNQFGGGDAFCAVLLGFSVVNFVKGTVGSASIVLGGFLLLGSVSSSLLVNEELEAFKKQTKSVQSSSNSKGEKSGVVEPPEVVSFGELDGRYDIVDTLSSIQFRLGPEGAQTKGAFKEVTGVVEVKNENILNCEALLDMNSFTTFNKYRDETLFGENYFDVAKFSSVTFSSGDVEYTKESRQLMVTGKMKMIGVEKDVEFELTRIKSSEGEIILIGKGELDRRVFGMRPDEKEGNIVSYELSLVLEKN